MKRPPTTSTGFRSSVVKRLTAYAKAGRREVAEAFMASDEFIRALANMDDFDRRVTMGVVGESIRRLWEREPIPPAPRLGIYQDWGPAAVEQLRQIALRYGMRRGLDKVIAREMRRPLAAVTLARYRALGRIRPPQPNRKRRNACVSSPVQPWVHPEGDPSPNDYRKLVEGAA